MKILQKPAFKRAYKKLFPNQKAFVDAAIRSIVAEPSLGIQKRGELQDIYVYKFKALQQEYLLAYYFDIQTLTLVMLGVHENFYRDVKKALYAHEDIEKYGIR